MIRGAYEPQSDKPRLVVPYLRFGDTVKSFGVVSGFSHVGVGPVDSDLVRWFGVARCQLLLLGRVAADRVSCCCRSTQVPVDKVHILHHILKVDQGKGLHYGLSLVDASLSFHYIWLFVGCWPFVGIWFCLSLV